MTRSHTSSSYMLVCDMRTPEGRRTAGNIMKALGSGTVMVPQSAAEKRAIAVKLMGEETVRLLEVRAPYRDGFRTVNERAARDTAEAVRVIAEASVPHSIAKAA